MNQSVGITYLESRRKCCPDALHVNSDGANAGSLAVIGNTELLQLPLLALFCSMKCPGGLILRATEACSALRDASVPVVSGFHSPVEAECLILLIRGTQPIICCPARSLETMRIPREWRSPVKDGRMLIVSPFAEGHGRTTARRAEERNRWVANLAQAILVVHAEPDGRMERFCREQIEQGKPVFTFSGDHDSRLSRMGAIHLRAARDLLEAVPFIARNAGLTSKRETSAAG